MRTRKRNAVTIARETAGDVNGDARLVLGLYRYLVLLSATKHYEVDYAWILKIEYSCDLMVDTKHTELIRPYVAEWERDHHLPAMLQMLHPPPTLRYTDPKHYFSEDKHREFIRAGAPSQVEEASDHACSEASPSKDVDKQSGVDNGTRGPISSSSSDKPDDIIIGLFRVFLGQEKLNGVSRTRAPLC